MFIFPKILYSGWNYWQDISQAKSLMSTNHLRHQTSHGFSEKTRSVNYFPLLLLLNNFHNQIRSDQSLSRVRLFATPWIAAHQASLSITNSQSSLRLTSIESAMPSSHLILCHPLLLLPPISPSIRIFSNESTLHMRWPKYWSFSFSIIPSK